MGARHLGHDLHEGYLDSHIYRTKVRIRVKSWFKVRIRATIRVRDRFRVRIGIKIRIRDRLRVIIGIKIRTLVRIIIQKKSTLQTL